MQHLNAKIEIQEVTQVQQPDMSWSETWVTKTGMSAVPCRINWTRGNEKIQWDQNAYFRDAKVYLHVLDINTEDRVIYDGDTYEIVDVTNPDSASKYMILDIKLRADENA